MVFIIAAGFLNVIFLKVKYSSPSIFGDMKLVRTNLDISLCSCIIHFPDCIREIDKEEKNVPLTTKEISDATLYGICVKLKEYNPREREKSPLFIPVPLLS